MHNLIRFIRQNKKKITKVVLIVAFIILMLQLLNYLAKVDIESSSNSKSDIYNTSNGTIISDRSAISGNSVPTSEIEKVNNKIEEFVKYCNEHNTQEAYNMLSDSCKTELYPNMEDFVSYYYEPLFMEEQRTYTIENWTGDTYIVRFTGDLLATGKSANDSTYQDYITIIEENGETKLNINKYIGREDINKKHTSENIETVVLYREKYMDYEVYTMQVTNNTGSTILLDQLIETDTIYLKDSNDTKHIAYSNEMIKDDLQIYNKHTSTIKIKFDNPYISGRKIEVLCFSKIVLNYDVNNQAAYTTIKFSMNL